MSATIPKFKPSVKWNAPTNISAGAFSAPNHLNWETCRERFQKPLINPATTEIYFGVDEKADRYSIASFLNKTETILKIKRKSTYNELHVNGIYFRKVLKINLSSFWKASYVRASLLTLLLRTAAGIGGGTNGIKSPPYDYRIDNYQECLFGNINIHNTSTAVKRFLCGYTKYTKADPYTPEYTGVMNVGWVQLFSNNAGQNAGEGWKALAIPDVSKKNLNLIGAGQFWG